MSTNRQRENKKERRREQQRKKEREKKKRQQKEEAYPQSIGEFESTFGIDSRDGHREGRRGVGDRERTSCNRERQETKKE